MYGFRNLYNYFVTDGANFINSYLVFMSILVVMITNKVIVLCIRFLNHEGSKKHKENVALMKQILEEEEEEMRANKLSESQSTAANVKTRTELSEDENRDNETGSSSEIEKEDRSSNGEKDGSDTEQMSDNLIQSAQELKIHGENSSDGRNVGRKEEFSGGEKEANDGQGRMDETEMGHISSGSEGSDLDLHTSATPDR